MLTLPEPAAVAAYIPVAESVVHKALGLQAERLQVEALELLPGRGDQVLQIGENPAINVWPVRNRHLLCGWIELVETGVIAEEGISVPELEREPAAQFLGRPGAEIDVVGRITAREQPAHYVRPDGRLLVKSSVLVRDHPALVRRSLERNSVSLRFVHLVCRLLLEKKKLYSSEVLLPAVHAW